MPRRGSRCSTSSCAAGTTAPASRIASSCSPTTTRSTSTASRARDGVRSFLQSRGIDLPMGSADDSPEDETIYGLGLRKNDLVLKLIHDEGVEPYQGSVRSSKRRGTQGLRRAVVSSSANCQGRARSRPASRICSRCGSTASSPSASTSPGKPAPDTFLAGGQGARRRARPGGGVRGRGGRRRGGPRRALRLGRRGRPHRPRRALRAHGADVVVQDLAELLERP